MVDIFTIAPILVILLAGVLYVRRLEGGSAVWFWAWSFVSIFVAGMLATVGGERFPVFKGLAVVPGTLSAVLALAGSLGFARRPVPDWLLPAGLIAAGARWALYVSGEPEIAYVTGAVLTTICFGIGGYVIWRDSVDLAVSWAERYLGPSILLFGATQTGGLLVRAGGNDASAVFVATATCATLTAFLQVLTIYERAQARDALHSQELEAEREKLQALLDTTPLGVYLFDNEGRLSVMNKAAMRNAGMRDDQMGLEEGLAHLESTIGRPIDSRAIRSLRAQLVDEPDAVIENMHMTIGALELDVFSSPVNLGTGARIGRIWTARDVTRERELQQQLLRAQKMETMGTLAGGVAHDFNNQLTTILGNARIALEESDPNNQIVVESLTDLERAADHCAQLTSGLLAFARRVPVAPHAIHVGPTVREVEGLLGAMLPPSIELVVSVESQLPPILADPAQLQQVLLNLAINARDAVDGQGQIRIDVAQRVDDGDGWVDFTVSDTGVGMEPEVREHMFEPFFTTKSVGKGTGIGLSIVYGVVRSHGGEVDVESTRGVGTRIRISIPAAEDERVAPVAALDTLAPRGSATVLLADDEPAVLRLASAALGRLGYSVIEARDGTEALELFKQHRDEIDVAVLDIAMPGRSGLQVLAEIRQTSPRLPVVLASGYLDGPDRVRESSGVRLLSKPYRPQVLGRAVHEAIEGR